MEENANQAARLPTGKREILLLILTVLLAISMVDSILYWGFYAGFALMTMAISICSFLYLRKSGCRSDRYANALFGLTLIIGASFLRSDDGFVKFVMLCFLLVAGNLCLVLTAGQNRRKPAGLTTLMDAPMAVFTFGFGQLGNAFGGVNAARRNASAAGSRSLSVLTGLAVAIPVMAVLIPLLIRADAAFEGLLARLPEVDFLELFVAVFFGIPVGCIIYARNTGLKHRPKAEPASWIPRYFSALTVNTVLLCVCFVYCVYLLSQLAYFVGGFSGILPEEYTMAEYARRGFFEMTWLAAVNLLMIAVCVALTQPKDGKVPLFTRGLCLFIGLMTLFFAATASAKMVLYIGSFGLTRLRLLVQVIIVFIALTVIFIAIWLFRPKFAYMKAVLLAALIIGSCVAWADVDTVVASYNYNAYRSGRLETLDMSHLCELGDGAVPYLQELTNDSDTTLADAARRELQDRARVNWHDLRSWNIASGKAWQILEDYYVQIGDAEFAEENADLLVLADYTETVRLANDLTKEYSKLGKEEPYWHIYLKDGLLVWEDGQETGFFLDSNAYFALEQAGIRRLYVSDCYVLFWSQYDDAAMLWTNSPDETTFRLADMFGQVGMRAITDQWYFITVS